MKTYTAIHHRGLWTCRLHDEPGRPMLVARSLEAIVELLAERGVQCKPHATTSDCLVDHATERTT
jgi:hypothetical protein